MFCFHCGEKLVANAKFCMKCGEPVVDGSIPVIPATVNMQAQSAVGQDELSSGKAAMGSSKAGLIFLVVLVLALSSGGGYLAYRHLYNLRTESDQTVQPATPDAVYQTQHTSTTKTNHQTQETATAETTSTEGSISSFSLSDWFNSILKTVQMQFGSFIVLVPYLLPVLLGVILGVGNFEWANNLTEKFEAWIRYRHQDTQGSPKKFVRFAVRPVLSLLVLFSDWTDSFTHPGWKNGVRITFFLYIIIFWLFALIYGAVVVLMVIFMGFLTFFLLRQFSPGTLDFIQKLIDGWKRGWELGKGGRR